MIKRSFHGEAALPWLGNSGKGGAPEFRCGPKEGSSAQTLIPSEEGSPDLR